MKYYSGFSDTPFNTEEEALAEFYNSLTSEHCTADDLRAIVKKAQERFNEGD